MVAFLSDIWYAVQCFNGQASILYCALSKTSSSLNLTSCMNSFSMNVKNFRDCLPRSEAEEMACVSQGFVIIFFRKLLQIEKWKMKELSMLARFVMMFFYALSIFLGWLRNKLWEEHETFLVGPPEILKKSSTSLVDNRASIYWWIQDLGLAWAHI